MTSVERLEDAEDYIRSKGEAVQQWTDASGVTKYAISYWVWKGPECLGKVTGTGADFLALVDSLRAKETAAIAAGCEIKPEPPPPAPVAVPSPTAYSYCYTCCSSQPVGSSVCNNCGCLMPLYP